MLNSKFVPQDGLDVTKLEKRIKIEKRKKKNYLTNVRNARLVVGNEKQGEPQISAARRAPRAVAIR